MTLLSFDQSLAGDYTVTVYNDGRSRHSTTTFSIAPSGPPEMPSNFQEIETTATSITVQWTKGFNGGRSQTFVILYRPEGGTRTETVSVRERQQSTYTKELTGRNPNTRYQLNMYAYNEEGNSSLSSVVDIISKTNQESSCTYQDDNTSNPNTASIALFIISSVMLATTVSLILWIICRRKLRQTTGTDKNDKAKSGVNLSQSPLGQHDNPTERSHYDDLNLEEREPPSNYECLGNNAAANANAEVSTDDRQMYESLGTRTNAGVYDELKGPASRTYENTVIR
ncbi:nephrin-like [Pecten maximus]|uniref:nephrin-like n=1 Tax=Pecten maximus TaxID=6579 RepID=UPI001458DB9A|nr:nephrin-like [Pecten maximus]